MRQLAQFYVPRPRRNFARYPMHGNSHIGRLLPAGVKLLILFMVLTAGLSQSAQAQFNALYFNKKFETKPLHFGIAMGYNSSDYRVFREAFFVGPNDTISSVESVKGPGFNLGIVTNLRLTKHLDVRLVPRIAFSERALTYTHFTFPDSIFNQSIESVNLELPALFKFKSDPYKDISIYVIGGAKYSYDLASNAKARNAEGLVKVGRHDFSIEYGIGMEIYFPMFILAPEIRFSHGLMDVHAADPKLIYSSVLERLLSRMVTITFNFEG